MFAVISSLKASTLAEISYLEAPMFVVKSSMFLNKASTFAFIPIFSYEASTFESFPWENIYRGRVGRVDTVL
jgi:hypothetical protein